MHTHEDNIFTSQFLRHADLVRHKKTIQKYESWVGRIIVEYKKKWKVIQKLVSWVEVNGVSVKAHDEYVTHYDPK